MGHKLQKMQKWKFSCKPVVCTSHLEKEFPAMERFLMQRIVQESEWNIAQEADSIVAEHHTSPRLRVSI